MKYKHSPTWKPRRVNLTCQHCGITFTVMPCRVKRSASKFCSRECWHSWRIKNHIRSLPKTSHNQNMLKHDTNVSTIYKRVQRRLGKTVGECSICGFPGELFKHHNDYSQELEILQLCPSCHTFLHSNTAHSKEILAYRKDVYLRASIAQKEVVSSTTRTPASLESVESVMSR